MGIGKKLIKFFEDCVFETSQKAFLVVADFNQRAKRLYTSLGYKEKFHIKILLISYIVLYNYFNIKERDEKIMWSREELKSRAKALLKQNYWKAFIISLVIAIAGGNINNGVGNFRFNFNDSNSNSSGSNTWISSDSIFLNIPARILAIIVVGTFSFILIIAITSAFRIFLGYPLEVGGRRYFIKSSRYEDDKNCFSFAFYRENYSGIVLTMLLKGIQNFLWYLLFIIPGIVKSYSYSMVPYILAENPNIGTKRAIELSNDMTDGHKFNMFVLDLSFIGWYILGMIALGLGVMFVWPYHNATKAELYLVLRTNALNNGLCRCEELQYEKF